MINKFYISKLKIVFININFYLFFLFFIVSNKENYNLNLKKIKIFENAIDSIFKFYYLI